MDKTLLRRLIRHQPLFKKGEAQIVAACQDNAGKLEQLRQQWCNFCLWLIRVHRHESEHLNSITREHIIGYGNYLKSQCKFDQGYYTQTQASNVSTLNAVMKLFHGENWEKVSPTTDCGLKWTAGIPKEKPALDKNGQPTLHSLAGYILELQSTLGVTAREALHLDLNKTLREAITEGNVTVTNLRTGHNRLIPCRPAALKALKKSIAARRLQKHLPNPMTFDDFLYAHHKLATRKGYSTNTARGNYVRERYRELTGIEAPFLTGISLSEHLEHLSSHRKQNVSEAKGFDKITRHQIAKELGVLGIAELTPYLEKHHVD